MAGATPALTKLREYMRGVTEDGRLIPQGAPGVDFFSQEDKTGKGFILEYSLIERRLREEMPELGSVFSEGSYSSSRFTGELLKRSPSLFVRVTLVRLEVKKELERAAELVKRAINRALSMKQRRAHIPSDLAAAYVTLQKLAHLVGLLSFVRSLPDLPRLNSCLKLAALGGNLRDRLERGPPLPKPIVRIPQAKPNAPGFSA